MSRRIFPLAGLLASSSRSSCRWCGSVVCSTPIRCADRFNRPRWWGEWISMWTQLGLTYFGYVGAGRNIVERRGNPLTQGEERELRFAAGKALAAAMAQRA